MRTSNQQPPGGTCEQSKRSLALSLYCRVVNTKWQPRLASRRQAELRNATKLFGNESLHYISAGPVLYTYMLHSLNFIMDICVMIFKPTILQHSLDLSIRYSFHYH